MKYIDADKLIAEIERRKKQDTTIRERSILIDIETAITSLQQEQPDLPSGEDVMTLCNQILIDWVKEGKTQEEVESREEAHSRFFELYDEYLMQEQPEVDFKKEIGRWMDKLDDKYCMLVENYSIQDIKDTARHFYELGLNTRKEE